MNNNDVIYKSFVKTKRFEGEHSSYPDEPGLYAIFLADVSLGDFGRPGQIIYIGVAKNSLRSRDLYQHFRSGRTSSSTLRRSLGAILKNKLNLIAIPRDEINNKKTFDNYKFNSEGENNLTLWMKDNLKIGYWIPEEELTYQELRDKEMVITIKTKPTLDLDSRTRKYNIMAENLKELRKKCKNEAQRNI